MDVLDCDERMPALIRRRTLVTTLAGSALSQVVPAVHSQADGAALEGFIALSRFLTGRVELDAEQASRLREALSAQAGDFNADARALLLLIAERKVPVGRLQLTLDTEASRLASLPRRIVSAWYTGIVGEGERARCVAFETSLMYAAVKDRLTPPSYCHGPHASWASPPG